MVHTPHKPPNKKVKLVERNKSKYIPNNKTAYLEYCLREKGRKNKPIVIAGCPKKVTRVGNACDYKEAITGGVLSFEELLPLELTKKIAERHRNYTLAGLNPDDVAYAYIVHQDHDRTEIHFCYANMHIGSGKRFVYYSVQMGDFSGFEAFQELVNYEYGLSSPKDPENKRMQSAPIRNLPRRKNELKNKIEATIISEIHAGRLQTRADIVIFLENAGFEVNETRTSISIKQGEEKPLRFKGGLYESGWVNAGSSKEAGKGNSGNTARRRIFRPRKSREEYERIFAEAFEIRKARQAKVHGNMCARSKLFSVEPDVGIQGLSTTKTNPGNNATDRTDATGAGKTEHDQSTNRPNVAVHGNSESEKSIAQGAVETISDKPIRIISELNKEKERETNHGRGNNGDVKRLGAANPEIGIATTRTIGVNQLAELCETQSRNLYDSRQRNTAAAREANLSLQNLSDTLRNRIKKTENKPEIPRPQSEHRLTLREFRQTFRKKGGYCVVEFRGGQAWVLEWFPDMPDASDFAGKIVEGEGKLFRSVGGSWVELQKKKGREKV